MTDIAEVPSQPTGSQPVGGQPAEGRTSRDDLRDFIGPNADSYLRAHDARQARRFSFSNFSWAACFIPLPWLLYRKMYVIAAVFLFGSLILGVLLPDVKIGTGIAGVFGAMGKTLYLGHAESRVRKLANRGLAPADHVDVLKRAGGVSWLGGVIGALITAGFVALVILAKNNQG